MYRESELLLQTQLVWDTGSAVIMLVNRLVMYDTCWNLFPYL